MHGSFALQIVRRVLAVLCLGAPSARGRALHYVGTTLALSNLVAAVVFRMPELLGAAVVSGYFFAWIGHFFIEKNRPATFTYPLWSLIADFKMFGLACAGRMAAEVSRVLDAEATGTSRPHS